ncbi:MAG TPA: 2-oxoacid:acceptor oxidoreductase subunit alpha, partial [Dehalococcoidales bacterium]|nr:2-oxoacid:acceptor oxidoreductase subunit alpha [Dehalococcoidales bacterium]
MSSEINVMVGGEAGQGIQTVGFILAKAFSRTGINVFADQDYESRVRGGHNFFRIRAADFDVRAIREEIDILIAIDQATVNLHQNEIKNGGLIIFDSDKTKVADGRVVSLGIPLEKVAQEKAGDKMMSNSVALGAAIAAGGYDFPLIEQVLRDHFSSLGNKVVDANIAAASAGFQLAAGKPGVVRRSVKAVGPPVKMMLLNGNEAIALGAMAAGCKFMASYPMTPVSTIMEYISEKGRKFNIVMIQPEDEIAAVNMAVGAGYAGVRAMTATAGDGFALMTEGLGLAGITETPVVIILGQRPGPAVGLPTRTEQGDLNFGVYAGAGEFPRAVFTPGTVEEAFSDTVAAFNLAEKYQIPVIVITDHHLASSYQTTPKFNLGEVKIDRGALISEETANTLTDYKRHAFTDSGISPRLIPLRGKQLVVTDADEHDESGHMIEDAELRTRMMQKRLKKLD